MAKDRASFRADSATITRLLSIYGDNKTGAYTTAIEGFLVIRRHSLHRLKGVFTEPEITFIKEGCQDIDFPIEIRSNPVYLSQHLAEQDSFTGLSKKHNVEVSKLIEKINSLHHTEVFFLIDEVQRIRDTSKVEEF